MQGSPLRLIREADGDLVLPNGPRLSKPEVTVVEGQIYREWEAIYQDNVVSVYRVIFARVGNRPDAEDLTSDVFLKSLPKLSLPAPAAQVRAYINTAVRSTLADHWRKHYGSPLADVEVDTVGGVTRAVSAVDGSDRAGRILNLLPDRSRRILELRYLRGYSIREAAKEMDVTPGNAKILQYRALRLAAEVGARMLS